MNVDFAENDGRHDKGCIHRRSAAVEHGNRRLKQRAHADADKHQVKQTDDAARSVDLHAAPERIKKQRGGKGKSQQRQRQSGLGDNPDHRQRNRQRRQRQKKPKRNSAADEMTVTNSQRRNKKQKPGKCSAENRSSDCVFGEQKADGGCGGSQQQCA